MFSIQLRKDFRKRAVVWDKVYHLSLSSKRLLPIKESLPAIHFQFGTTALMKEAIFFHRLTSLDRKMTRK